MRGRALALSLVLGVTAGSVSAQTVAANAADTSVRVQRYGDWLVGASFGVPGYGSEALIELFTIGLHWTQLRPGRLGGDFSLGTMPRLLGEGVVVVGLRVGGALPLVLSRGVVLFPSAGASVFGGAGAGGGGGALGLNAGIAGVIFGSTGTGFRTGVTWHRFEDTGGAIWLLEIGFVR